jgi:hypothetical protein
MKELTYQLYFQITLGVSYRTGIVNGALKREFLELMILNPSISTAIGTQMATTQWRAFMETSNFQTKVRSWQM